MSQAAVNTSQMLRRQAGQMLSGGRFAEGIALLEQALASDPSADIYSELARACWRGGQTAQAEDYFTKALRLKPEDAHTLNGFGTFLLSQNRFDEAAVQLTRALALQPGHHEIANNLGLLYHRSGDLAKSKEYFLQAVRTNPGWPVSQGNLGNLLRDMKDMEGAEAAYRTALKATPDNTAGWQVLVELFREHGAYEKAVEVLNQMKSRAPFNERAWLPILELQENMNRLDEAAATLAEVKSRFPGSIGVAIVEGRLLRRRGDIDGARKALESIPALPENSPFYIQLNFELGQLYDVAGDADAAFAAFARAKAASAKTPEARRLDANLFTDTVARMRRDFTPELAKAVTGAATAADGPSPVFLVGFPRSGTTLLDQILSGHPAIRVAEEEPVMNQLTIYLARKFGGKPPANDAGVVDWLLNNPAYPACLAQVTEADAAEMRRIFWAGHRVAPEAGKVFVDKLPLNIRHAALIHRIFPGAKFILALRHPCDSVLSGYMQKFKLNPAMMPFLTLEGSAKLYDEVFSLWDAYAKALPLNVHTIRYEDVVADIKPAVAPLLTFLGVAWDDAVLDYDKTARARNIATPSYSQVTEKIYTRAAGRWQRYRKHLAPVLSLLETHAKNHGYSMDAE